MSPVIIRQEAESDREAVHALLVEAFPGDDEARLVEALRQSGAVVLALVAEREGRVCGHVLFSRLMVSGDGQPFAAVALAPLATAPAQQRSGIGAALVQDAHRRLRETGETLSIVLGDPAYYGRFGYAHARAAAFDSAYQCAALQALAWGEAPVRGRLDYAPAFNGL